MKKDIDIEKLKEETVERLKPLNPGKIILFGNYAYGNPDDESDIDLFLVKSGLKEPRQYTLEARKRLRDIIMNHRTNGIDILASSKEFLESREDYFYRVDILKNGKVLYEQNSS
ncbi:MAG: nucleotidyltransferase domain-containing protein [Flexistipes sinusarabici]|uniref:Nucleotidyltransferase domain-containing protein n=1 Tax=Flexistipes sinusarabici TaxID=2352 RepID=A0A5D0MHA3_FLESI|nr:nucleotidyltransferase domain-containing protein [Flexistipes sinusarabici]TYB32356.1 MAG: nucleotidyltransferase domain-containing protein [Flexistipes sinusarabici]